jgi:hypothetical protein
MADLKQVAAIFNDCIEAIRNQRHPNLKKTAVEWLKGARYQLMREVEAQFVLSSRFPLPHLPQVDL